MKQFILGFILCACLLVSFSLLGQTEREKKANRAVPKPSQAAGGMTHEQARRAVAGLSLDPRDQIFVSQVGNSKIIIEAQSWRITTRGSSVEGETVVEIATGPRKP